MGILPHLDSVAIAVVVRHLKRAVACGGDGDWISMDCYKEKQYISENIQGI